MDFSFSFYDYLLIAVVGVQGTIISFIHHPRLKAFMVVLPVPFTLASLAVGNPVGINHMVALILLFFYNLFVFLLYKKCRIPIFPAIIVSAAFYCITATFSVKLLPDGKAVFWAAAAFVIFFAVIMIYFIPLKIEEGQRSNLPLPLKFLLIVIVVTNLVFMKKWMQEFITLFPMVGVIASYECRKSLWTMIRQIPILIFLLMPLLLTAYVVEPYLGLQWGLTAGWVIFLSVLIPYFIMLSRSTVKESIPFIYKQKRYLKFDENQ